MGIPGSGKTTLSHQAAEILREKGISVLEPTYLINNEKRAIQRYLNKTLYCIKLASLRPAWASAWCTLVVQSKQKTLKDFVLMIINGFFVLEIYRYCSRNNDICFLDQGICQALLSLSYHSKTENFLDRQLVTALDLLSTLGFRIIHIEVDVDTTIQRLKNRYRKQSRLELLKNSNEFVEVIRSEKRKIENLLEILRAQLQADIATIPKNSSDDIHSSANQISELITSSRKD